MAAGVLAAAVFVFAWFYRFNDPGGSFAGLTDDHFFYLVRGWQILFGDLPVRDFVDHGAPLFYYIGAAVQLLIGRGTVSEVLFCTTVLAAGAALTFWLAAQASGSLALGLIAVLFQVLLEPRFYNYPKILVYALAIPLIWRFVERPTGGRRLAVAAVTALGFFFRHDHGLFVALATVTALAVMQDLPWRVRLRHGLIYIGLVVALVVPYLVFIEVNEGLAAYLRDASDWAAKDRSRAPVVWPGLFDNPDGVSDAARTGQGLARQVAVMRDNMIAWVYYVELYLPLLALAVLALSRDGFRPAWPRAVPKMAMVAVLGIALDAGFLRSPLGARLADPSVPHAIMIAWLATACGTLWRSRVSLRPRLARHAPLVRAAVTILVLPVAVILAISMTRDLYERLDKAALVERPGKPLERAAGIERQLRQDWELASWANRPDRPDLITLSMYLNACTSPDDRIFVQPYIPQVLAMARRAFAGGHADLRPGFFDAVEAQTRTIERLRRQSVPVALLESGDEYRNFRKAFPLIADYFDANYRLAATRTFDGRFVLQLFARVELRSRRDFTLLDWPCFR
jgi:hypothetical protein